MRPSPDGRDRRNARGRTTIRAIERAAVALALQDGVDALTVDRICEAVGLTQRSFFNHFDTKEDALLGWELPLLDPERVAAYLADPVVGVLTGALGLVRPPAEVFDDPGLLLNRIRVLRTAPDLAQRQVHRMLPVVAQVEDVVVRKLTTLSDRPSDADALRRAAAAITTMAAALLAAPGMIAPPIGAPPDTAPVTGTTLPGAPAGLPSPDRARTALSDLAWVWPRLL